ncbi:hypothetical protein D9613_003978 [Agrocybe pediades]|uniref:Ubinuclein middle domain-containing protein n=1 Tax=Agrocybe pediades TaxID=84607 RepID=A0A8H4VLP6_9AGAR|nr:hypothetical protein D9613_003978 [Agrocybe pediades]
MDIDMQTPLTPSSTADPISLVHSPSSLPHPTPPPSATPNPPSTASTEPASTAAKPKSTKHTKPPRSPSPTPPPPFVIPLKTVRLEIKLGGPSNYEADIRRLAKESGQAPPSPPPQIKKVYSSESEDDDEDDDEGGISGIGKRLGAGLKRGIHKSKKKTKKSSEYDTSDPFIDDSELAVDQRTFFAQTKQQGFYVSSGEVALLKDKGTPKKPKSKKISFVAGLHPSLSLAATTNGVPPSTSLSAPLPSESNAVASSSKLRSTSISAADGTRDAPISIDDSDSVSGRHPLKLEPGVGIAADAEHVGQKRKRQATQSEAAPHAPSSQVNGGSVSANGTKRKKTAPDESSFHPSLQAAIAEMKELIKKESWEVKGKFPPALKPPLARLAVLAIRLDEYDDDFFSFMPVLFPYNKFTMTKLIKRTVYPDHLQLLVDRQEVLLKQLKQLADEGFEKAKEEWEKSVIAWDKRQEKARNEQLQRDQDSAGSGTAPPTRHGTEEMDVDGAPGQGNKEKDAGAKDSAQHPPAKRYRMTDQMKAIVWELVLLSNESCRLENEKNQLENSTIQVSEQALRKILYQKIVAAYPDGWMSSGQISRDVSAMKKRLEKEQMEQDNDD